MAQTVEVLVRLERGTSARSMLPAFEAAGMRVGRVMSRLGVVAGAVDAGQVDALRALEGVRVVEADREVRTA